MDEYTSGSKLGLFAALVVMTAILLSSVTFFLYVSANYGMHRQTTMVFLPAFSGDNVEVTEKAVKLMKDGWTIDSLTGDGCGGFYIALSVEKWGKNED